MLLRIYKIISYLIYPFVPIYLNNRISSNKELKDRNHESYGISTIDRKKGELIWKFSSNIELEAACNVPGHYEAGMIAGIINL